VALHGTPSKLHTFAETVNQPLQPRPECENRSATVATFAGAMEAGCIIMVPLSTDVFRTELEDIYLEHNDLERFLARKEISAECICVYIK